MRCSDALLIHLQGDQASDHDRRAASSHIARCPSCAGTVDDLHHNETTAAGILRTLATHHAKPHQAIRISLGLVAGLQLLLAVPWLFGLNPLAVFENNVGQAHLTRDGAIGLFVGIAGLITAIKPRYATQATLVSGIGVVTQVAAGAIDEHHAHVDAWFELFHVLTIAILVLTGIIAGSRASQPRGRQRQRGPRLVTDDIHDIAVEIRPRGRDVA